VQQEKVDYGDRGGRMRKGRGEIKPSRHDVTEGQKLFPTYNPIKKGDDVIEIGAGFRRGGEKRKGADLPPPLKNNRSKGGDGFLQTTLILRGKEERERAS